METLGMIFENVVKVFFGNVRRAGWSLLGIAILYFIFVPGSLERFMRAFMNGVVTPVLNETISGIGPFMGPVLAIVITLFVIRWIFGKTFGGGKKKGRQ